MGLDRQPSLSATEMRYDLRVEEALKVYLYRWGYAQLCPSCWGRGAVNTTAAITEFSPCPWCDGVGIVT